MRTILSLQPNAAVIGYTVLEDSKLVDWGTKCLPPIALRDRISRVALPFARNLLDLYNPDIVILPVPRKGKASVKRRFLRVFKQELTEGGIPQESYRRQDIRECFGKRIRSNRPNKHTIMQALVKWFPELQAYLPKPRRLWDPEHYYAPMFDALSLSVTYLDSHD